MFNDKYGLTKAVLEGRKTMTRRLVPERMLEAYYDYDDYVNAVAPRDIPCIREYEKEFFLRRSRYKVGEVVAVAQSYIQIEKEIEKNGLPLNLKDDIRKHLGYRNKMFVKADLMPHQIRITSVRVERLQDITSEDALREGIYCDYANLQYSYPTEIGYCGQYPFGTARDAYAALIDKVSGKGTWKSNPWVFVYQFELVK